MSTLVMNTTQNLTVPNRIATLYILQCNFNRIDNAINELRAVWQDDDALILMEDAVFAPLEHDLDAFSSIYVLNTDAHLIAMTTHPKIQSIHYLQFAELIAHAEKVLTWK